MVSHDPHAQDYFHAPFICIKALKTYFESTLLHVL